MEILSICDYPSKSQLNELRLRDLGHQIRQLLKPRMSPTGLIDGQEEIDPNQYDVVFVDLCDYRAGISLLRGLRESIGKSKPIILAVDEYDGWFVREGTAPGLVDMVIDRPASLASFDQFVRIAQRLTAQRRSHTRNLVFEPQVG